MKNYDPSSIESKWYEYWISRGFFHSEPDSREPYTIVIPPPNVTGILHMGHILNNTLQDVLVRRARMMGKNACWVPGTDHASIATEAKVVAKLAEQGIKKSDLSREEFLQHAWRWKEEHGGIILKQLRTLGASCDWDRTKFTMDPAMSESVIKVFVDLYNKGLIYRGVRMVNWDPAAQTALSDEEVIHREQQGKLYYLRYKIEGGPVDGKDSVIVATTRPETILGDVAVCVNPNDPRYTSLKGKRVIVPLVGRSVPVIYDDYVDMDFGTGALKITPAHDVNDYVLGERFGLEVIDIFNPDGTINERVGLYVGQDRFAVRDQISKDLQAAGLMEKVEDYTNKVGFSERTGAAIEPKLSMQWFVKMDGLAEPALKAVMDDTIRFVPSKYKNTYNHWMSNIKDWCISRQLWWGQRIPAYFLPAGGYVVAQTPEEALELAHRKDPSLTLADLRQDEDVLDTWFSSWLWPISVFDGIRNPDNADIGYYYPTNDLVTGPDIIFFWVARMIMAGEHFRHNKPFGAVYFTGIVRDKLGRKMSKQLGNSPDPLELIEKYGADGVRMGLMLSTSAGNDVMFDEAMCEQGRNFGNKIWNAWRLIESWQTTLSDNGHSDLCVARPTEGVPTAEQPISDRLAVEWFSSKLDSSLAEIDSLFANYRLSDALMVAYKLFWDDFSGWYLEIVKPAYGTAIHPHTLASTKLFLEKLLQILHPFIPFITEELWHSIRNREADDCVTISSMPTSQEADDRNADGGSGYAEILARFDLIREAVTAIRAIRRARNISPKEPLELKVVPDENFPAEFDAVLQKMAGLSSVEAVEGKDPEWEAFIVKTTRYFVPLPAGGIDRDAELVKLREELAYQQGFLNTVMQKLSNERFVGSAPAAIVANEQTKRSDAEARIAALKERIAQLS